MVAMWVMPIARLKNAFIAPRNGKDRDGSGPPAGSSTTRCPQGKQ